MATLAARTKTYTWDSSRWNVTPLTFKGAKAISGVLNAAGDAVDAGSGVVTLPFTGHGFLAGSWVYIQGSVAYDGFYEIQAVAANTFNINAVFVAEAFAGTEYAGAAIGGFGRAFRVNEIRLHLNGASANESLTYTLDSSFGAEFDVLQKTQDMNGLTDWDWDPDADLFYQPGDIIKLAYANSTPRTYGLEITVITMKN